MKHFKTDGAFRWRHENHVISLTEFSSGIKSKMTGDFCFFLNSPGSVWTEKRLMRFQTYIAFRLYFKHKPKLN